MENKIGGDLICRRPETIIEARFNLTKRQNDILDMVFASIEDDDKLQYQIDISKYGQLYNIKDKSNIYRDLKKAVKTFESKGFSITTKNEKKKEHRIYFAWFSSIEYIDGESKIVLELGKRLKELMLSAKKACFYQLKYSLNFHNIYSKRFYYYLKSYENSNKNGTGWRKDNIDELRVKLDCPKTYERYAEFKRSVLKPAYDEINGNSDISFEFEEYKIKNKVTSLKFYIRSNKLKRVKKVTSSFPIADEVAATSMELEEENQIEKVMSIMSDHKITTLEARKIYDSSKGNVNVIYKVYNHFKNKEANNFIGLLIDQVRPGVFKKDKKNCKKDVFNDFLQHGYTSEQCIDIEKKLLGN